mgnify:CR=1 FL=1
MELGNYIGELVIAGSGIAATATAYIQGKKNAKSTELDNVVTAIKIWQDTAESLTVKLQMVDSELTLVKQSHEQCEENNRKLSDKVEELD